MDKKVVIIGGGIIGLSSAYYLHQNGYDITILEKGNFADACSKGNQGWVCPALHTPVPEPGLVGSSIKWLMKKDSPLYIKPSTVPRLSNWIGQFMKHCNERDFKVGKDALHNLSHSTFDLYDSLRSDGLEFEMHRQGMLFVFLSEKEHTQAIEKFTVGSKLYGHETPIILSGDEVRRLEPSISNKVVGGLLLKEQRHVNPETVSKAFVKSLESSGVKLRMNTEVTEIEKVENKVIAIKCGEERFEADTFLLTAGAWSGFLAKQFNYNLPIQAGKGYSITISNPKLKFEHPIYLGDSKSGISPFNGSTRIGGTMELSGINSIIDSNRIQGVRNSVSKYLNEELHGEEEVEWAGMRPMTPDGLPVLGLIPDSQNAFVATGHGMVGVSMAPVTGKIMSDLISTGITDFDIEPFDPRRFSKTKDLI